MDTFHKLFGSLLALVYHCFDRIVILGYLPFLTREEQIVYFFRDVQGIYPITKQALAARTQQYQQWVEAFARNHRIPIEWADNKALKVQGLTREDYVRPYGQRMARPARLRAVLHLQKPRKRSEIQRHHAEGADPRSRLSSHPPDAWALYALLFLHS
jgi:hypothetical protein